MQPVVTLVLTDGEFCCITMVNEHKSAAGAQWLEQPSSNESGV